MQQQDTYTTQGGSVLPILKLRGKDYLEVKYRLVWFREDHPTWSIETSFVEINEDSALARAVIKDESGRVIATSHKFENAQGFPDYLEKAETGSIGRALALIGYGTQFCADELDEGERIVDAPANPIKKFKEQQANIEKDAGLYTVKVGRKYKGKTLSQIPEAELRQYIQWLKDSAESSGTPLVHLTKELVDMAEKYLSPEAAQ